MFGTRSCLFGRFADVFGGEAWIIPTLRDCCEGRRCLAPKQSEIVDNRLSQRAAFRPPADSSIRVRCKSFLGLLPIQGELFHVSNSVEETSSHKRPHF